MSLTPKQRAILEACAACPFKGGRVGRWAHHPFVVRSLEKRGLVKAWEPQGFYHGSPQIEITDAGREALNKPENRK